MIAIYGLLIAIEWIIDVIDHSQLLDDITELSGCVLWA